MSSLRIGVLHGPNLNLLGRRNLEVYGTLTLSEIDARLEDRAKALGVSLDAFQANHEGALIDWLQAGADQVSGYVVNAAAFTHTSVALRDALEAVDLPFVEVHMSNIFARESFRRASLLSDLAVGVVTGFGEISYVLGLEALVEHLRSGQ
jgi:3-dehydroquinate dehydratase II